MKDLADELTKTSQPIQSEIINVADEQVSDSVKQNKFDETRIELFKYLIYLVIIILVSLVIMLIYSIHQYLCLLHISDIETITNFWHIPLILAFMISTILGVTLTLTSRFGENKPDNTDLSNNTSPILLQDFLQLIKDIFSKK